MSNTDHEYDVVVVGSGGGAFGAALGAVDEGLTVLMVESTDKFGGSTAMSGGGLWMPNNPLMQREGVGDSREEALTYMERTIGDEGPATSRARKEAFVDTVEDFVLTAESHGVLFTRAAEYPDYYPELPGGKIGRLLECQPFNGKKLGEHYKNLRLSLPAPAKTDDVWLLQRSWSTPGGFIRGAQVVFRILGKLVTGQKALGLGGGLVASLAHATLVENGVPLWLNSPAEELIVEDGRVVGITVNKDGVPTVVRARGGVILAGGGFDRNAAMRKEHHGIEGFTSGNPGNLGGPIGMAESIGAATALMDDAWWGASIAPVDGSDPSFIVGERSLPYSLIVDSHGKRFANEAESYVDLGHAMLEHDRDGSFWFITDARHSRRYFRTYALDPRANKARDAEGIRITANSLAELGWKLGFEQSTFRSTIERFNGFARSGRDQDFDRGDSAYDRYYGDPTVRPNPCLGTIEKGPFTALKVVPGDLGTKGGVLTDESARALRGDGSIINGLYATGNNSASVMGRTYPGPGATIGPAAVFGLIAARHIATERK